VNLYQVIYIKIVPTISTAFWS